ncbi:MAG: hypothetical protein Q7K55_03465 [Candidatus Levybacteria bacterium]|nr:hypothetical protein [Candidatus Levybacteria bacterium]
MIFETEGRFLQPFHSSLDIDPTQQQMYQELTHPVQVGGIVYANNTRGIVLVEYGIDELRGFDNALREDFSLEQMDEGRGRIVALNDLNEVRVGQLDRANLSVKAYESLRGRPSVSVEIQYKNVNDQIERRAILDEDAVLRFLTGQEGGIAIFEGWGLPEENALVFKQGKDEARRGLILFIHPNESQAGINSVKGVREFFEELNREFTENCSTPLLSKALAELREKVRSKVINFDSPAKAEIFKAQVIANARLFEKTGDTKYMDYLQTHLFALSAKRGVTDIFRRSNDQTATLVVDQSVNSLFITDRSPLQLEGQIPEKGKTIYNKLKTEEAKKIRKDVEPFFGLQTEEMYNYLTGIVNMVNAVYLPENLTELDDMIILLDEFKKWEKNDWWYYTLKINEKMKIGISWGEGHNEHKVNRFVDDVKRVIERRRKRLTV